MSEQNPWETPRPEGEAPVAPQPQLDEFGNPIAAQPQAVPAVEETAVFPAPQVMESSVAPAVEQPAFEAPAAPVAETPVAPAPFEQPAVPATFEQPAAPAQPQYGAYAQPQQPAGFEQPVAPAQPQYGAYAQPQQPAGFEQPAAPYTAAASAAAAASSAMPGQPPYGAPIQQPGGFPGQPGTATPVLPGRGKSITMIVMGLVMMFILAPISFFAGIAIGAAQNAGKFISNEVVVESFPVVKVTVTGPNADTAICGLIGENGIVELYPNGGGDFVNDNVPRGKYEVACDNVTSADTVIVLSGDDVVGILANGASLTGLIISFVLGVVGFILLIVGIVKLVKVNKQRKLAANPYGW